MLSREEGPSLNVVFTNGNEWMLLTLPLNIRDMKRKSESKVRALEESTVNPCMSTGSCEGQQKALSMTANQPSDTFSIHTRQPSGLHYTSLLHFHVFHVATQSNKVKGRQAEILRENAATHISHCLWTFIMKLPPWSFNESIILPFPFTSWYTELMLLRQNL